jgi:hypothetical protein
MGGNFAGGGYAYTEADIFLDPVLQAEDVKMKRHTTAVKYVHAFELLNKSARIDITQGFQKVKWKGLLNGTRASTRRTGWTDTFVRFAVNLYGAPPLRGKKFKAYRTNKKVENIIGAALRVRLPTGHYEKEKLLNIGDNRFVFTPQLGFVHKRGKWTGELTSQVSLHTKNDDFFNGNTRKQKPMYFTHAHLLRGFRPGEWLGLGIGYQYGGENTVNGADKNDRKRNIAWAVNYSYPLSRRAGLKVTYVGTRARADSGFDSESLILSAAVAW